MLHPHVPEDLKHFGKHLFATFLGLIMALGLEQWREHRQELRLSEESLHRIEAELRRNRDDTAQRLVRLETEIPVTKAYYEDLERAVAERRAGRKAPLPVRLKTQNPDFGFTWSAWEGARATGGLRHIDPTRLQRMSEVYADMQRFIPIQDQLMLNPAFADLLTFAPLEPESLRPQELDRLLNGFRFNQTWNQSRIRIGREMLKELDEALKP
ncbi:hypothetical protein GETHLI_04080 [Geothrix limicola]|uniref:Uncharacterized protein n=1 Tax=Geothrix limicola TaxID=2927978 RepID=A0ABQ5QC18_9BACT|nr:hypothetical protein [Geothrix limicola]GLH71906.1 hypothetical protein GETHLI_04080 [Geothrix limicola]